MPRFQTVCPLCPSGTVFKRPFELGRHIASSTHQSNIRAYVTDATKMEELRVWEQQYQTEAALQRYLGRSKTRERQYQNTIASYGKAESQLPTLARREAIEGQLTDRNELGPIPQPSTSAPGDDYDVLLSDPDNLQAPEHVNFRVSEPNPIETMSNSDWSEVDERMFFLNGLEDDTMIEHTRNEDDPNASEPDDEQEASVFGHSDHFEANKFFSPPQGMETPEIRQPDDYYPFQSEVSALLYIFVNCPSVRFSEKQLEMVWWLVSQLVPGLKLPSLRTILNMRHRMPRPDVLKFNIPGSGKPYYSVSILDIIRMQYGLPGARPKEIPEVSLHKSTSPQEQSQELWNGFKWRFTPELNRPVFQRSRGSQVRDIWIGDIIETTPEARANGKGVAQLLIFTGQVQHHHASEESSHQIFFQAIALSKNPLTGSPAMRTRCGTPLINEQTVTLLSSDAIWRAIPASGISQFTGYDVDEKKFHDLQPSVLESLKRQHPLRQFCDKADKPIPVRQSNVVLWNDGMSGVVGSRWNPYEIWTVSIAGIPHRQPTPLTNAVFVSAGKDIDSLDMVPPLLEELKRLQRGIVAFDANIRQKVFVCGGLVEGVGDNPAASKLCSHNWKSPYTCRVCLYNPSQVTKWEEICDGHKLRTLDETLSTKNPADLGLKMPLNGLFDLPGLDPHQDWPYEILHSAFLGYIKYLWCDHTLKHSTVKKHMGQLSMMLDATSNDAFASTHRLYGRRATKWSKSFIGTDYRFLVQVLPTCLLAMFRNSAEWIAVKDLVNLWCLAAKVTKLLCMHQIPDVDAWITKFDASFRQLIEAWSHSFGLDSIRYKTKLHQLSHVSFWVRRFGPTIIAIAERNEAANKHIRAQLQNSNRLAASRDLALRYAAITGLQYISQEGIWRSDRLGEEILTRAGDKFHNICKQDAVKGFLGTGNAGASVQIQKVYSRIGTSSWQGLNLGNATGVLFSGQVQVDLFSRFCLYSETSLTAPRRCRGSIGSFVCTKTSPPSCPLFRVVHIIKHVDKNADFLVLASFKSCLKDPELNDDLILFRKSLNQAFVVVRLADITEILNVQHVCGTGCKQEDVRNAYVAEREEVAGSVWSHSQDGHWVLNPYVL